MRWDSFHDFEVWLAQEQQTHAIKLRLVNTYLNSNHYVRQLRYVCSRGGTGGKKAYVKLHPDWNRKIQNKGTDCECCLLVKQYPGTPIVLGAYNNDHNHELGNANLRFVRIPKDTREHIAGLLRLTQGACSVAYSEISQRCLYAAYWQLMHGFFDYLAIRFDGLIS
jgi:hypothetical protein